MIACSFIHPSRSRPSLLIEALLFASVVSLTLLTQIVGQALLNAAVVTALVPTTGIPHPLVSYGGSSLVVTVVSFGIIVSLSRADRRTDSVVLK